MLLLLCVVAALRVFLISAAFPLFNNVDEPAHFDLVLKYSHGHVPRGLEPYGPETGRLMTLYASPEYMLPPESQRGIAAPPWSLRAELLSKWDAIRAQWSEAVNYDAAQPPFYYAAAGIWYRFTRAGGGNEGRAIYSIRFLNMAFLVVLIGAAYVFMRRTYPDRVFLRLGVPAILAFLPQDFFYSISNDVPVPLLFAAAFYSLLDVIKEDRPSLALCAAAGAFCALTVLDKLSALPVLGVLTAAVILKARKSAVRPASWAVLVGAAMIPICGWALRNQIVMGDALGTAEKARLLGWTPQPLAAMLRHPIFTPRGAWFFIDELLKSFWRGEFFWHRRRLWEGAPVCERFFTLSSIAFLGASAWGLRAKKRFGEREADAMSFLAIGLSVLFLVSISISYDFGDCPYPSRSVPFLFSGRLIAGVMVPFFALYLDGLERLLARWRRPWLAWAALGAVLVSMCAAQVSLVGPIFGSAYNWFHLP